MQNIEVELFLSESKLNFLLEEIGGSVSNPETGYSKSCTVGLVPGDYGLRLLTLSLLSPYPISDGELYIDNLVRTVSL